MTKTKTNRKMIAQKTQHSKLKTKQQEPNQTGDFRIYHVLEEKKTYLILYFGFVETWFIL